MNTYALTFLDYDKRNCLGTHYVHMNESVSDLELFMKALRKLFPQYAPYCVNVSIIDQEIFDFLSREFNCKG